MSGKVTINQGRILPGSFRFLISVIVFTVMGLAMQNLKETPAIFVCIAISFLMPLAWSSYQIIQIIPEEKMIRKGYWIAGFKKMKTQKYTSLTKIFINKGISSQTMHSSGGRSSTFSHDEFRSFLETEDGDKLELISTRYEDDLLKKLKPIASKLAVELLKNY